MAKNRPRRTELRGIRPSLKLPPNVILQDVERMGGIVQELLLNCRHATKKDETILKQVRLLAQRRKAIKDGNRKEADGFLIELNRNEEILHSLGLQEHRDIVPLNLYVLEEERQNRLEELIEHLEEKCHV